MEQVSSPIKGTYRDTLCGSDGTVLFDSGWRSNMIVNDCHVLMAALVKILANNRKLVSGAEDGLFLCVGEGLGNWDDPQKRPVPKPSDQELKTKYSPPFKELGLKFMNKKQNGTDTTYEESTDPTNILEITATLGQEYPNNPNYPLREFGLFAKLNGKEYMINHVIHPVITKGASATLERVIHLEF